MIRKRWMGDIIWLALLGGFTYLIASRSWFFEFMIQHKLIGGFIKFGLLASMGELLVIRLKHKQWNFPAKFLWRVLVWGGIGVVITQVFTIFHEGVMALMDRSLLPGDGQPFFVAFFTSLYMNLLFAPVMMGFHKYTDTVLDLRAEGSRITISNVVSRVDWEGFIKFALCKTIPMFWIPAHTLTFLLPADYRVVVAAYLSIALGLLLTVSQSNKKK